MPEKKRNAFSRKIKNKYFKWVTGDRQSSSAPGSSHGSTGSVNNQATTPQSQVTAASTPQSGSQFEVTPPPSVPTTSLHLPPRPGVLQSKALSTSNLQNPGTMEPQRPSNSAFEQALQKCVADLSEDDKAAFKSGEDVMRKIQLLNQEGSKVRLRNSLISDRFQKVLGFVRQFMGSIQIFIQYSPEISSLAVGGVNCVLSLVLGYSEFLERLTEMMERIGGHVTNISNYGREVFLRSQEAQETLAKTYCDLMEFFAVVRHFFLKFDEDQSSYRRGFNIFLKTTWEPFEMKCKLIEERFSHHALIVVRTANALDLVEKYEAYVQRSAKEDDRNRRDVLNWLSPDDYDETHERHWMKRSENTGGWLTDDGRFTAWRDTEDSQLLWCHGALGVGKTVLASLVVEHLLRMYELSNNTGVTFLYCDYKEPREPVTYIRLAIKQLCQRMEHLPDELLTLHNTHFRNQSEPSLRELQYLFVKIIGYFDSTVFLVLDALDECSVDQRRTLMDFLKDSIKQTSGDDKEATILKVFITSRREEDIQCAISAFPTIEIQANLVNEDIQTYVTQELDRRLLDGSLVLRDPSLNDEIRKALIGKADGMFLWVDFQLKAICDQVSNDEIRSMLESLPEDMEETYERIINMIKRPQSALARTVLMWMAYSERPLGVEEMVFAVATEKDTKDVETLTSILPPTETILAACTNLVIVDGNGFLRFVHFSVQEFLLNGRSNAVRHLGMLGWELAHLEIAHRCIIFLVLCLTHFKKSHYGSLLFKDSRDKLPPFFRYALSSWHYHCRALPAQFLLADETFLSLISSFFEYGPLLSMSNHSRTSLFGRGPALVTVEHYRNSVYSPTTLALIFGLPSLATRFSTIRPIGRPHAHYVNEDWAIHFAVVQDSQLAVKHLCEAGYPINTRRNVPPLACVRSVGVAQLLMENGADVNAQGGEYGNALQAAVFRGNQEIVELLLQNGADFNAQGGEYGNALQAAASRGNREVVEMLLRKGADVNAQGGRYGNALQAAVFRGNQELVELLLQQGADVNAQGGEYCNALQTALSRNNLEVVKLLLRKGADVNAQGGEDGNAVQVAVLRDNWRILVLLLQKGADVNAPGGYFGNALQAAASMGNREVVEALLQMGANVNAQGGYFGSALQAAVAERKLDVVELLLQKGADVNVQGGYYGNSLQAASYRGDWELLELLLERGADVNVQGGFYGNALQAALSRGDPTLVEILLQKGVDVNAQCGEYGNALQNALARNDLDVLELLLQNCVDLDVMINAQGGLFGNALQAAASEGNLAAVELLLQKGADINAQGGYYGNALQAAVSKRHRELLELLLQKGADVNAQGGYYGNALQAAAASERNLEVVELLLQKGANVNAQGGYYGSALQAAVSQRDRELFELLLQHGADVNVTGGIHGSALLAAIYHGPMELIKLLLEAGADVHAEGGKYGNALRMAAAMGEMGVVNALAERGACLELEDPEILVTLPVQDFERWYSPARDCY